MAATDAFAVLCDAQGTIVEVICGGAGLAPGVSLADIVDPEDLDKYRRFLAETLSRQAAFDWVINVVVSGGVVPLNFAAACLEGDLLVAAAAGRSELSELSATLTEHRANGVRDLARKLRAAADATQTRAEEDAHIYDELTRLNNELASTQRHLLKSNRALALANEQLNALHQSLPIGIFLASPDGTVLRANEQFRHLTGGEQVSSWLASMDVDAYGNVRGMWQEAVASGRALEFHHRRPDADGETLELFVRIMPMRPDQDRGISGFVGTVEDVSPRLRLEQQRRELERSRAVRDVTAGVAHNLNNIMMVILGSADQFLLQAETNADGLLAAAAERNKRAVSRASMLVSRLMAYSEISVRSHDDVNVDEELARLSSDLGEASPRVSIDLKAHGFHIYADRQLFVETLQEIIKNARRASGTEGHVRISSRVDRETSVDDPGFVVIEIEDEGAGMDAATLSRAKEPFFTTHKPGEGVGLGLSFADGFARMAGGSLTLESAHGRGTRVRLRLPAAGTRAEG